MTAPVDPRDIASRFPLGGQIVAVVPFPGGHINETYRVKVDGREDGFLLQRLNPLVFQRPDLVMRNVAQVTRYLARRLAATGDPDWRRHTLVLFQTEAGADWVTAPDGAYWRLFTYIRETFVREHVQGPGDARAAGSAFGAFLRLLADYDGPPLHDSLPGFHDTEARFAQLESAVRRDPHGRALAARPEIVTAMGVRGLTERLRPHLVSGVVPRRVVHNDAKLSNVLFDEQSGEPLCVIDLDTVMPGLAIHDFGDLVRSVTSPTAEDEEDLGRVGVRRPLFEALAQGFLQAAGTALSRPERQHLVLGSQLIILEQAVRFLTDHLEGDRYYRTSRPDHNLIRCRTQLKLFATVVAAEAELNGIIASCP